MQVYGETQCIYSTILKILFDIILCSQNTSQDTLCSAYLLAQRFRDPLLDIQHPSLLKYAGSRSEARLGFLEG